MLAETKVAHGIPVIDKMMTVLLALERAPEGVPVARLARELQLSRTTVYRMLNTLEAHGMVARANGDSAFALGPTLIRLARRVPQAPDIATASRSFVEALAARLGRTVKISVREGDHAVVVAVALGAGPFSIAAQVGRRFPLHAGAASKLLLAFAGPDEIEAYLARKLSRHTDRTITSSAALKRELVAIRDAGWAEDRGEFVHGVRALAVGVTDATQRVVAALSVTFVAGDVEEDAEPIVSELSRNAALLSASLGA